MTTPVLATQNDAQFTFSYRLYGLGWADAQVACDGRTLQLSASYLGDALSDLLRAIELLWDGASNSDAYWQEEPGHYHWEFRVLGSRTRLRLLADPDTRSFSTVGVEPTGTLETVGRRSEVPFFEVELPLGALTRAIATGAAEVLQTEGELNYLEKWSLSKFPTDLLHRIQSRCGLEPTTPPSISGVPDPLRGELDSRWDSLVRGSATVEETTAWRLSVRYGLEGGTMFRNGLSLLGRQLRAGELTLASRSEAAEALDNWRRTVASYDADPIEWHRCQALQQLARSLTMVSPSEMPYLITRSEYLLDRGDIDAMIRGMKIEVG